MSKAIHIWCTKTTGAFTGFKLRFVRNKNSGPECLVMGYSRSAPIPQSSCPVYLRSIVAINAESIKQGRVVCHQYITKWIQQKYACKMYTKYSTIHSSEARTNVMHITPCSYYFYSRNSYSKDFVMYDCDPGGLLEVLFILCCKSTTEAKDGQSPFSQERLVWSWPKCGVQSWK